ncbi:serine hydrolase domain-containing protein [Maricaulis sp.]|uniref:serine hydrolase domain-containing protein n=1 Tax=Maricaulis sp. TaxID=1486257 RepID=UPI003A8D1A9D
MKHALLIGLLGLLLPQPAAQAEDTGDSGRAQWALDCEAAARYSRSTRGIAVLVVLHGTIVCEDYAAGIDPGQSWELASGAKSFTSVIAAAAVQDGLISLDEQVADTITEWQDDPRRSQITVRHLLAQTSGLASGNDDVRIPGYRAAIRTRARHEPGAAFIYSARHFQAFGEFMRRKLEAAGLDATPAHYLTRRVLAPAGIELGSWGAIDGMPVMSEAVEISPRNWARFGALILGEGVSGGVSLVDRDALAASFEPGRVNPVYGLSWWLPDHERASLLQRRPTGSQLDTIEAGEGLPALRVAAGAGRQRLYLIPELDLLVVRMTRGVTADPATREARWSDTEFLTRLLTPLAASE